MKVKLGRLRSDSPEFEEPYDDKSIKAMSVDDLVFSNTESAGNPRDRREEAAPRGGRVERDVVAARERASVVYGCIRRLFLQDGEQ